MDIFDELILSGIEWTSDGDIMIALVRIIAFVSMLELFALACKLLSEAGKRW